MTRLVRAIFILAIGNAAASFISEVFPITANMRQWNTNNNNPQVTRQQPLQVLRSTIRTKVSMS